MFLINLLCFCTCLLLFLRESVSSSGFSKKYILQIHSYQHEWIMTIFFCSSLSCFWYPLKTSSSTLQCLGAYFLNHISKALVHFWSSYHFFPGVGSFLFVYPDLSSLTFSQRKYLLSLCHALRLYTCSCLLPPSLSLSTWSMVETRNPSIPGPIM